MPRKIDFPPLPGTEDEQWDELAAEFGMKKDELKKIIVPSWMFDKGFINKWDVRKMLLNKGYKQIIKPEEDDPEKAYNEWLEKHPFTKKWMDTCPGGVCKPSPVYEKPKYAETINAAKKIDIDKMEREIKIETGTKPTIKPDKLTRKEMGINANNGRAGYYSDGEDRFEDHMIDIEERKKDLRDQIIAQNNEAIPGVERIKPLTKLSDTDQDYGCDEKQNLSPGERILKEYAKDKKREEIKRDMSKYIMNDQEEEKIKNMLHLKETKKDNDAVFPGDFDGICRDLMALHARKNKDYGNAADASYREFGLVSYVIRLNDKMNRLKSLTKPGVEQEVKSESIEDTLMDLAAYAIMAIESLRS